MRALGEVRPRADTAHLACAGEGLGVHHSPPCPPPARAVPGGQDLALQHAEMLLRKADAVLPPSAVKRPARRAG